MVETFCTLYVCTAVLQCSTTFVLRLFQSIKIDNLSYHQIYLHEKQEVMGSSDLSASKERKHRHKHSHSHSHQGRSKHKHHKHRHKKSNKKHHKHSKIKIELDENILQNALQSLEDNALEAVKKQVRTYSVLKKPM